MHSLMLGVVTVFTFTAYSHSLIKLCQACCRSLYLVESEGSGRLSLDGEMKVGILGSLDNGLMLECILPGLWMMTILGKATKMRPQPASLLFTFSYVFTQVNTE